MEELTMLKQTITRDILNGVETTGVKTKNLRTKPRTKGRTTVQLINKDGSIAREVQSENLIKESFYEMFRNIMRVPFTSYSRYYATGAANPLHLMNINPYTIELVNDSVNTDVESDAYRDDEGDIIGFANFYNEFTGEDALTGTIELSMCHSKLDIINRENVYSCVFKFPENAANGTFNKINIRTINTLEMANPEGATAYTTSSMSSTPTSIAEKTKMFSGALANPLDKPQYMSIYEDYMIYITEADMKAKHTAAPIYKAYFANAVIDKSSGLLIDPTAELVGTLDCSKFLNINTKGTDILYSSMHITADLQYALKGGTTLGTSIPVYNSLELLRMSDGVAVDLFKYRTYSYAKGVLARFSPDLKYIATFHQGQSITNNDNSYFDRAIVYKIDFENMILGETAYYDNLGSQSFSVSGIGNLGWLNDNTFIYTNRKQTYKVQIVDNGDSTYSNVVTKHSLNIQSKYMRSSPIMTMPSQDGLIYYADKNVAMPSLSEPSDDILCQNALPTPITKTDSQIMRVQYDFVVPWDSE
jgi:hypothetical protein